MIIIPPPLPPLRNFKGSAEDLKEVDEILERMEKAHDSFVACFFGMLMFGLAVELVVACGVVFFWWFS